MLHHGGMWKEEVSERMFVASTMQHTRILRLKMFLERCCITVACGKEEVSGEGCCITEECGRKRLVSECLLHWNVEEEVSEYLLHQ